MANELTVAVDFDNTMCKFCEHQAEVIFNDFHIALSDNYDAVKTEVPWKDFGYTSWWNWLRAHAWLWALAPAEEGAVGGIARLRAQGHRPQLLTAKPEWAEAQVWKWLSRWQPRFEGVQFCGVDEPKSVKSDADVLIDDRVDVVEEWVQSDSSRFGVLFRQPWNSDYLPQDRIIVARGWPAVLDAIDILEDA